MTNAQVLFAQIEEEMLSFSRRSLHHMEPAPCSSTVVRPGSLILLQLRLGDAGT